MIKKIIFIIILFGFNTVYGDCKISQNENSHSRKGHGSMYAIDYACNGGAFDVNSPEYFPYYRVTEIGFDKRLGNFVILKHGDLRFLYGHTKSDLRVGSVIKKGTIIGKTVLTGITTGHHFHLELWKKDDNIRLSYLKNGVVIKNKKSRLLLEQRGVKKKKEIKKEEGKIIQVLHKDWDINDHKQGILAKLLKISSGNLNFIGTVLGENGNLNKDLRSYRIGANGYYDYGLCQINKGYHKEIVNNPDFWKLSFQVKQCWKLWKGGTKFYGAKHKDKMIAKLIVKKD